MFFSSSFLHFNGMGATKRTRREIECIPYAGFFPKSSIFGVNLFSRALDMESATYLSGPETKVTINTFSSVSLFILAGQIWPIQ